MTKSSSSFSEQAQLSQPFLIAEVLQTSEHPHGSPLVLLQQLYVFPELETSIADTVFQMLPHEVRVERDNHIPVLLAISLLMQPSMLLGLLGCKCTPLTHV